jgi:hypothetical protein
VPGLYAGGDVSAATQQMAGAIADGSRPAAAIHDSLAQGLTRPPQQLVGERHVRERAADRHAPESASRPLKNSMLEWESRRP